MALRRAGMSTASGVLVGGGAAAPLRKDMEPRRSGDHGHSQ